MSREVIIMDIAFEEKNCSGIYGKNKRARFIFERKKDPKSAAINLTLISLEENKV